MHQKHREYYFSFCLIVPDVTSRGNFDPPSILPPVDSAAPPVTINSVKQLTCAAPAKV